MTDKNDVQQIVEQAVGKVLSEQLPQLQAQLVQRVLQSLPGPSAASTGAGSGDAAALLQALTNVHAGSTQKEILRTLLDGASVHCARVALFVVKAGAATGWQGRGFSDDEA